MPPGRRTRSPDSSRSPSTSRSRRSRSRNRNYRQRRHSQSKSNSRSRSRQRNRSRSRSNSRGRYRDRASSRNSRSPSRSKAEEHKTQPKDEIQNLSHLSEEEQMKIMMGFSDFDSTKGKAVEENKKGPATGTVRKDSKRQYRQYMNRRGGFNRPLD